MKRSPPPRAIPRARALRRNPTPAETALWKLLRQHFPDMHFRRQVPIGHAIVDFACHRARLVIEVDGGQHSPAVDAARTAEIERHGYRVRRVWNGEVLGEGDAVVWRITGWLGGG